MGNSSHACHYTNVKRNNPATKEPSGLHIDPVDKLQADWDEKSDWTVWKQSRINVKTFHLGCNSDKGWDKGEFGGIIIYSMGALQPKTDVRMKPGYVFIKNGWWLKSKKTDKDEGMIHGVLCRILTGYQPTEIAKFGGSTSGFSINDGVVRINSGACNANKYGIYNTSGRPSDRSMNAVEEEVLTSAIAWWKLGGGQNYKV